MKNLIIPAFTVLTLLTVPVFAAQGDFVFDSSFDAMVQWKKDIDKHDSTSVTMKNGRLYTLDRNMLIENPDSKMTVIRNVFDFENGLIYHEDTSQPGCTESTSDTTQENRVAVTPMTNIPVERVKELRTIACHITHGSLRDTDYGRFYTQFCPES